MCAASEASLPEVVVCLNTRGMPVLRIDQLGHFYPSGARALASDRGDAGCAGAQGLQALACLEDCEAKESLQKMISYVLERLY